MSFNKRYVDHKKILIYKNRLNDLFSDKKQAVSHMNGQIKQKNYLVQRGKIKDGTVQLVDEHGKVREQLSLGEL